MSLMRTCRFLNIKEITAEQNMILWEDFSDWYTHHGVLDIDDDVVWQAYKDWQKSEGITVKKEVK